MASPIVLPYGSSPQAIAAAQGAGGGGDTQKWDTYVAYLGKALEESSGFERWKVEQQYEDALRGRENAYKIAKLQADTSRYGYDQSRQTALDQLKEEARQFDANHGLELQRFGLEQQKFGLSYAQAATEYMSSPDRFAQGQDFMRMAGRALQGQGGPEPYGTGVQFQPKTEQDFAVLAGYGQPGATQPASSAWAPARTGVPDTFAGGMPPGGNANAGANTGGGGGIDQYGTPLQAPQGGGGTAQADPRLSALQAMFKAVPPSQGAGLDDNDYGVLGAAASLMSTNLQPGTLERMRPDQRAIYSSYVKRSGRSWNDYQDQYDRQKPRQGNVRSAY